VKPGVALIPCVPQSLDKVHPQAAQASASFIAASGNRAKAPAMAILKDVRTEERLLPIYMTLLPCRLMPAGII